MKKRTITWLGFRLGNHVIEKELAEGIFSWAYLARHQQSSALSVFKVAKPVQLVDKFLAEQEDISACRFVFSGGVGGARPDPNFLIREQAIKLQTKDALLPIFYACDSSDSMAYIHMEYCQGQTLAQMLQSSTPISLDLLISIVSGLLRLSALQTFVYHGDLKPANIIVTAGGIKLIDPGYFGKADCSEATDVEVTVTTPNYYPLLTPDDRFAFAALFYELACKKPLMKTVTEIKTRKPGKAMLAWIQSYESVGHYYLSSLRQFNPPSDCNTNMNPLIETAILNFLGFALENDEIERKSEAMSFTAMLACLLELKSAGIISI